MRYVTGLGGVSAAGLGAGGGWRLAVALHPTRPEHAVRTSNMWRTRGKKVRFRQNLTERSAVDRRGFAANLAAGVRFLLRFELRSIRLVAVVDLRFVDVLEQEVPPPAHELSVLEHEWRDLVLGE